jgi:threonine dehydrogenase-like Zn-dependent dehydrogenase
MKATVFHGPRDVRVETLPDPVVKAPTDAIVRITRAAIYGSDLHSYHGNQQVVPGFVLGHEGVGVVEEIGKAVGRLKKGQRVVVAGAVACGQCFFCRRGQVAQCSVSGAAVFGYGKNFAGTFGEIGGEQAEAVTVPLADYTCYVLPDAISDEAAIFLADILPMDISVHSTATSARAIQSRFSGVGRWGFARSLRRSFLDPPKSSRSITSPTASA